jgi:hypothetical protein
MDKKKTNTNVKTTMDFFKQKRAKANNKKLFSHIEINSNVKSSTVTSSEFNSTMQGVYKSDIFQIDSYLNKIKQILMYFSETRENLLLYNKDFNSKINSIKENLNKDTKDLIATNRINSLNINYLFKEYKCNDKDTLISDMAYENFTLKLLLDKLDDLFFLINIKLFDSQMKFSKNYKNNLSQILNVKYLCEIYTNMNQTLNFDASLNPKFKQSFNMNEMEGLEKGLLPMSHMNSKKIENDVINEIEELKEKEKEKEKENNKTILESKTNNTILESKTNKTSSNIGTTKKSIDGPSISHEQKEISVEIVNDITNKINEMKKFSDFLNFDYDQEEFFRDIFEKIRELFYVYNKHMFDPIVDLINNKFQVKSDLSNKVQIVLKNEVNDCYENVILMRKVLEDNFKENQTKITELNNEKKVLEKKYNDLEVKFNKQQKTLEEIGNRDYSNYYKQMKESNEMFLKEFEKIEKQRNEKLYEQHEKQLEKNKTLKKEIKELKSEIFALKKKIDNFTAIKDKTGDDYITALQEQFEDAKESFQEEISNITDEFYKKRKELQQKCTALENENKHLKGIQAAIIKKFDTMESIFSK